MQTWVEALQVSLHQVDNFIWISVVEPRVVVLKERADRLENHLKAVVEVMEFPATGNQAEKFEVAALERQQQTASTTLPVVGTLTQLEEEEVVAGGPVSKHLLCHQRAAEVVG